MIFKWLHPEHLFDKILWSLHTCMKLVLIQSCFISAYVKNGYGESIKCLYVTVDPGGLS